MKDYSNYYDNGIAERTMNDGEILLEHSLNSELAYEVSIKNATDDWYDSKIVLYQKWDADGEAKKIYGRIKDIERGNLFKQGNQTWLITTMPEDNRIYRKAELRLCSTTFPIREYGKVNTGKFDNRNHPIMENELVYSEDVPCVVEMNSASVSIADTNKPINALDNKAIITIPYRESSSIVHDAKFVLFGMEYRIIRIDPSKSINKVGLLLITGEMLWKDGKNAT